MARLKQAEATGADARWAIALRQDLDASKLIDAELQDAGVPFSVGELANVRAPYPEAIPLLVRHLRNNTYPERVQEAIVRALTVKYGGAQVFDELFWVFMSRYADMREVLRFAFGNALAGSASRNNIEALVKIANDPDFGDARAEPLYRLAKWKVDFARKIALKMLANSDMPWDAIRALRLFKEWSAASLVEPFIRDPNQNFREEARKFMKAASRQLKVVVDVDELPRAES